MERILFQLEDKQSSYNVKELLLSIIQRATVFKSYSISIVMSSEKDALPSSYWLLKELTDDACMTQLFDILQRHLHLVVTEYQSLLESASPPTDCVNGMSASRLDFDFLARQTESSSEIANNIFLVISRLFQRYNQGSSLPLFLSRLVKTGRGGYNACFNTTPIALADLAKMGRVRDPAWMQRMVRQCRSHLCAVFNTIQRVVIVAAVGRFNRSCTCRLSSE